MKKMFTNRLIAVAFLLFGMLGFITATQAQRVVTFSGVNTNFVTGNNVTVTRVSQSQSSQSIPCLNASNISYISNNSATGYIRFDLALSTEKIDSIRIVWKSGAAGQVNPVVFGESIVVGTYLTISNVIQATNGGFVATAPIAAAAGTNCNGGDTLRFPSTSTVKQILIPRCINYNATAYSASTQYGLFPSRLNNGTSTGYTTALNNTSTSFIGLVTLYISNIVTCAAPTIGTPPSATTQTLCQGATATALSVVATGSGTLSYQWKSSTASDFSANVTNVGTNSDSYTPSTAAAGTLYYRCVVTNDCGGGSTNTATSGISGAVTVNAPPSISSQSTAGATYPEGGSSSALTVTAAGAGLSYQWYSSTDAVTNTSGDDVTVGTNSNSYAPSTAAQGTLYYYCVVAGTCTPSPVTSSISGAINVVAACTAPEFFDQPIDFQSTCSGTPVSLGTVTTDIAATYQWYIVGTKTNTGGTAVTLGTGGTTDTYTPPATTAGTFYYYCVASNGACTTASDAVEITVEATAITGQSTATATYSLNASATALSVTATGQGLGYQWYSNTTASNTGGTLISGATGNTYTPLTTTLGTTYYYCIVTGACNPTSVTSSVSGAILVVQFSTGDYKSVASANWGTNTTWQKWSGSAWVATASGDFPNATTASVYIDGGFTVNIETSGRNIKNLFISGNSTLKSSNLVNNPSYLRINGTTVSVEPGSLVGNLSAGNNADGISLDVFSTNVTVTGGGTINLSRIRTNTAGTLVTINTDVTLNYHGSGNAGNAAAYYTVAGANNILTVNAGKTLTFAPWACYTPIATSHSNSALNQTINVDGTITFVDGLVPGNATANGWSGHTNGYFSFGATTGTTFILNIGSTGTMNVSEFYPNGTLNSNAAGTGTVTTINVAAGGTLNVTKIADFRNAAQTVTGAGTFSAASGAVMRIGSVDGIAASGATGNIQTGTRSFSTGADYAYEGTAAQASGTGLPSVVNNLTINNSAGVTLSVSSTVNGVLALTSGKLATGANKVTVAATGSSITGTSASNYINGNLERAVAAGASTVAFPVGDATNYAPASLTFAAGTTAGNVTASTSKPNAAPANGSIPTGSGISQTNYINRNWTLSSTIGSANYAATFTYINPGDVVGGANTNALLVGLNNGGTWSSPSVATSVAPDVTTTSGLTSFGTFSLGEIGCINVSIGTVTYAPFCAGQTTTLTANSVAGTNPLVSWYTGANASGSLLGTGLTLSGVGAGTYYAHVTGDCGTAEASVILTASGNTFSGTGNWSDNARWSCGAPPASGDGVTIAAGANATLDVNFTVAGSLTMNATSTLTVASAKTLTVSGTANFNGQSVTFKSDATGTASLGQVTGTLTGATNVTVERYLPNNGFRSWRLLSVPTFGNGQTIKEAWQENQAPLANNNPGYGTQITTTGANAAAVQALGFDNTSTYAALLKWNGSAWITQTSTLQPIAGQKAWFLFVRGDRTKGNSGGNFDVNATTLRTNGTVYTGDQVNNIGASAFALVGNVYPSAIDFTGLPRTGGVSNIFYIWDSKKMNGNSLGAYQTFSGTNSYNCILGGGSYTLGQPNTVIESGQAFFVQSSTAGTITLKESAKINPANGNLGLRPAAQPAKIDSRLYNSNNDMLDANTVVFDAAYSKAVDAADAPKLGNPGVNFAIETDSKLIAIEGTAPVQDNDVVQFRMWNLQPQAYQLEIAANKLAADGLTAVLEDKYLQTATAIDLNSSIRVNFTVDANAGSADANRFRIVFKKAAIAIADSRKGYSIAPNPVENGTMNLQFRNQAAGKYAIRVMSLTGQTLKQTQISHAGGTAVQQITLPANMASGSYQVEIIRPDKTRTVQMMVVNSK